MSVFDYKLIRSSWGIGIRIDAQSDSISGYSGKAPKEICDGVLAVISDDRLSVKEIEFIFLGLRCVCSGISRTVIGAQPVVINVLEVSYNPCDYQEEGLVGAMVGWAAQEFGFNPPEIPVKFDSASNQYIFQFPEDNSCP